MHVHEGELRLAATDLSNHLACRHLTELDRAVAEERRGPAEWHDPMLDVLRQRGLEHEAAYVEQLRDEGTDVVELRDVDGGDALARTVAAMRVGAGAIVQAALADGRWRGRADVLLRVDEPSDLGAWSYEVVDAKLAQETRGGTVLQLCLYSELVGRVQGREPVGMHVVKPALGVEGLEREELRFADYAAYYRLVKRRLEGVVDAEPAVTYPDPVSHCDVCRWWRECDRRRHADDHLSLVAGIGGLHVAELQRQGIATLEELALEPEPLREPPQRGHRETFARIHDQARVQLRSRREERPVYELLAPEPGRGLLLLPEPSPGDVFFDIESDPFVDGGGLEYLLGVALADAAGGLAHERRWALGRVEEKRAFEWLVDLVMTRWAADPGMHVYVFSGYEEGALKRLATRHATREAELDRILRGDRIVDLLAVTRQGLRAGVESYSLKKLEAFYGFEREIELADASLALLRVARALELRVPGEIADADRDAVERYNREDCEATAALRAWLEERRAELVERVGALVRPQHGVGDAKAGIEERAAQVQVVYDGLVANLPEDRDAWDEAERARWLLAHQLEYFRREAKSAWWEYFRLKGLPRDERFDERKALEGIELVGEVGRTKRDGLPIHRYRFPQQEVSFKVGATLHELGGDKVGSVAAIDTAAWTLDIAKRGGVEDVHPSSVFQFDYVNPSPIDTSLLDFGHDVVTRGVDAAGERRAARDLLLRRPPRLRSAAAQGAPLQSDGEDVFAAAIRLAADLDGGVLAIQGPPGTGKTYAGGRMITALARAGKRVGVTAVSHEVIRNLLWEAIGASEKDGGEPIEAVHLSDKPQRERAGYTRTTSKPATQKALDAGKVVGGTAWLWAREDKTRRLDYLFVDEAGQLSLANTLGAARAARNLVLLGDPQQLEQPQQAAHPEGAEVAALAHLLGEHKTMPADLGLFLGVTRRLHPDVCRFTSEVFYEGKLHPLGGLERQALVGDTRFAGSGLRYVPVEHADNSSSSPEEVDAVARIVAGLLGASLLWIDEDGESHPLDAKQVLVVAPYNAQVAALIARLPAEVRVGTVDKFQGQEAAVVIYSATSSSAADAPRGMSFLYDPNRLNVATSRARCACILVAAPQLLEPDCRTPEQMRWANALCRFRELAGEVALGGQPG